MKVLVCGSRDCENVFTVSLAIDARMKALPYRSVVIHGDARGADRIAAEAAHRHGCIVRSFPADWKTHDAECKCPPELGYCRQAGKRRNIAMLDDYPSLVIAFWNGKSRGTAHTISEARKRGIPVEVVSP